MSRLDQIADQLEHRRRDVDPSGQHTPDAHVRRRCGCVSVAVPPSGILYDPPASDSGVYDVVDDELVSRCFAHAAIARARMKLAARGIIT